MMKPGEDLVAQGIADLKDAKETVASLLVSIGAPRLKRIGLDIPSPTFLSPERRLYSILNREGPNSAHSRYNALIRRLVSYERAAKCAS